MEDIREQMDISSEIMDGISAPVGMPGLDFDDVRVR